MIAILVLQGTLISSISVIANAILITFTALSYVLLLLIGYDYVRLVRIDPVDPRLKD